MKFKEIASRLTGFSVPVFGVSWNPPEAERSIARRMITSLEDKRVLYNPNHLEVPEHCIHSVVEIRHLLTHELSTLQQESALGMHLRGMRAACRKFLDTVQADERVSRFGMSPGHYASWIFLSAVGELRGVFGLHVAAIAAQYGLDVEKDLASILPVKDEKSEI